MMLRDIRLRFWPTYYDCIRWSKGGAIAILANEYVYILVPSKQESGKVKGTPQFQATRAEIVSLQRDDVVVNELGDIYSIGEEQGPGYVKAIEWSPLGMSRRRDCMLAILTTTHRLKISEFSGHQTSEWRDVFDIGQLIQDYRGWETVDSDHRIQRLRSRSRSMAWSYGCALDGMKWGYSILAVTNDNFEVLLILISSEVCKIVVVFRPEKQTGPGFYPKMSWSPWNIIARNKAQCLLTIVHKGKIVAYKVSLDREVGDIVHTLVNVDEDAHVIGSAITERHPILGLTWYEEMVDDYWVSAYAIQCRLRVVAIRCNKAEPVTEKAVRVWEFENEFLDPVSGLIICPTPKASMPFEIHLSTILGNTQIVCWNLDLECPTDGVSISGSNPINSPRRNQDEQHWDYIIQDKKQDFIAEWDVNSATCKVWGIAKSPLASVIATVISLEPDDSLQYVTHSKETSRLVFGTHIGGKDLVEMVYGREKLPPVTHITSENFIMEFANFYDADSTPSLRKELASSELGGTGFERLVNIVTSHCLAPESTTTLPLPELSHDIPRSDLVDRASYAIYNPSFLTTLRLATCMRLFPQRRWDDGSLIVPLHLDNPTMVKSLILSILWVGRILKPADLQSQQIIYSASMVGIVGLFHTGGELLGPCQDALSWLNSQRHQLDFQWEQNFIAKANDQVGHGPTKEECVVLGGLNDKMMHCTICGGSFKWEDLVVAECSGGHRYPRCSVTYLPIQSEDTRKTCGLCERNVLHPNPGSEKGAEGTLLSLLVDAWDICVHCGGRYC